MPKVTEMAGEGAKIQIQKQTFEQDPTKNSIWDVPNFHMKIKFKIKCISMPQGCEYYNF